MVPPSKLKDILAKFESNINGNQRHNNQVPNPRQRKANAPIKEKGGAVVVAVDSPSVPVKAPCIEKAPVTQKECTSAAEPHRRPKVGFADGVMGHGAYQCNGGAPGRDSRPDSSVKSLAAFFEMQSDSRLHRQSLGSRSIQSAPEKSSKLYRKWSPPGDAETRSPLRPEHAIPLSVTSEHMQASYSKSTVVVSRRAVVRPVQQQRMLATLLTLPAASTNELDSDVKRDPFTSTATCMAKDPTRSSKAKVAIGGDAIRGSHSNQILAPASCIGSKGKKSPAPADSGVADAASSSVKLRSPTSFIKSSKAAVNPTTTLEGQSGSVYKQTTNLARASEKDLGASTSQQITTHEIHPSEDSLKMPKRAELSAVGKPPHVVLERSTALPVVASNKVAPSKTAPEVVVSLPLNQVGCDKLGKLKSDTSPAKRAKTGKLEGNAVATASFTATAESGSTPTSPRSRLTTKAKKTKTKSKKANMSVLDESVLTPKQKTGEATAVSSKKKTGASPPVTKTKKTKKASSKSKSVKSEMTSSSQSGIECTALVRDSSVDMDCHASFCMTESPLEYRSLGLASTSNFSHESDDDSTIMLEFDFEDDYSIGEASEFGRSFASSTADFLSHIAERSGNGSNGLYKGSAEADASSRVGTNIPSKFEPNNMSSSSTTRTETESCSSFDGAYWRNDKAIVQFGERSRHRSSIPGRR